MKLVKLSVLAFVLFTSAFATAQNEFVTVRRPAPLAPNRDLRAETRVVSQQILKPFQSRQSQLMGYARVQIQVPVCGQGPNAVLDIQSTNFNQQVAKMGGPIHLFESQNIDLGFLRTIRRGVGIADSCVITPTLVTLNCGYLQALNLRGIRSDYRTDSLEGITCRYNFAGTRFIDVSLTDRGIEVFNGF